MVILDIQKHKKKLLHGYIRARLANTCSKLAAIVRMWKKIVNLKFSSPNLIKIYMVHLHAVDVDGFRYI